MIEETTHQRPGLPGVAGLEQRSWFYATIENIGLFGPAQCDLPDVLQGKAGVGGKSNGSLLGIGPTLSEIVAGSQKGAPITLRGRPDAMLAIPSVVGHGVDIVAVEIGATNFPAIALRVGAENERSFCGPNQQKEISFLDVRVADAVQEGRWER